MNVSVAPVRAFTKKRHQSVSLVRVQISPLPLTYFTVVSTHTCQEEFRQSYLESLTDGTRMKVFIIRKIICVSMCVCERECERTHMSVLW